MVLLSFQIRAVFDILPIFFILIVIYFIVLMLFYKVNNFYFLLSYLINVHTKFTFLIFANFYFAYSQLRLTGFYSYVDLDRNEN